MAKQYDLLVKLLLIGDSNVGKTCMICRFADEAFDLRHNTTIGIDFMVKSVALNGKRVRIQIWDTAGQEKYDTLTKQYYRRAHGILIAYDITSEKSFQHLEKWLKYAQEYSTGNIEMMIVATKCDMTKDRKITTHQGLQLAGQLGIPFYETSAKDDNNIQEAFFHMAQLVMARHKREFSSIPLERQDSDSEYISELLREGNGARCDHPCCT